MRSPYSAPQIKIVFHFFILLLISSVFNYAYAAGVNVPKGRSDILVSALKNAQDGDILELAGGTYQGNFIINKAITLESKNAATLTANKNGTLIKITAPNVVVSNLRFKDSGTNISDKDSCIYLSSKAVQTKITNNDFDQCEFAIWVDATPKVLIDNNHIKGTMQRIVSDRGNAIYLFYTKGTIVQNNDISQGRDGIYISNSTAVMIKNNKMHNTRFGIHYMYSDACSVIGNTTTNSRIGAALMYSKRLHVFSNTFKYNNIHGVLLRQILNSEIVGNLSSNNEDGIFIGGSYYNTIRNNNFISNTLGVIITSGSTGNKVYDNNFIDNKLQAKYLNIASLKWGWNGRGNYWSTYIGWDRDRSGVGNKPYYVTNLANWLTFSYPVLRVVLDSPAMTLLQKIENEFPVMRRAALIDKYPLMRPV